MIVHEAHKAARPVAALTHFSAIRIKNPVAKVGIGTGGFFDQQNLVATYAEVTVGNMAQLRGRQIDLLIDRVEDDEIIAQSMHFGET